MLTSNLKFLVIFGAHPEKKWLKKSSLFFGKLESSPHLKDWELEINQKPIYFPNHFK